LVAVSAPEKNAAFLCRCLFYFLRQAALEAITTIGEALSNAAYDHVERLAKLKLKDNHTSRQA